MYNKQLIFRSGTDLSSCSCSSCSCWGDHLQKSPRLHHFKSDRVEILQDCPSSKYASVDGVGYFYMTSHFQDRGHDVISRNKVLPPGE